MFSTINNFQIKKKYVFGNYPKALWLTTAKKLSLNFFKEKEEDKRRRKEEFKNKSKLK